MSMSMRQITSEQTQKEFDEGLDLLLMQYGNEEWFYDAYPTLDDCGTRIQIEVLRDCYHVDVLPRKFGKMYAVVVKVDRPVSAKVPADFLEDF